MDTLISHATVVTMDEQNHILPDAFVGITEGKISYLSRKAPGDAEGKPQTIIDGTGLVLMPGLINCHAHMPMTLLRGYADDCNLKEWLDDRIGPREDRLDSRCVKAATRLAIAESLQFGVTSFSEMYNFCGDICEVVAETGIKANISRGTLCFDGENFDFEKDFRCQESVELLNTWQNYDNGRIRVDAAVHGEYTSCYQMWDAVSEYAINNNLRMHVHLSETENEHESCKEKYGLTPAQILDCHHVFDNGGLAAHCVWLEEEDMDLLAKRKVSAVHCPISNGKLGSGAADVMTMIRHGMNVALGTDSVASNNNLDLFEEIKAAALEAKILHHDATALNAQAALMMATVCGARAQGREKECGMVKLGMDADLILLDFTRPHLIPCHDVLSQLAYACSGHDVCMTMVRGKILYANGQFTGIDMNAVVKELTDYVMPHIFSSEESK